MPKKVVLFPEIGRMKFFNHLPARISIKIYIFDFKNKQVKTNTKETKEEKRISLEN